jgi:hypothetical protein
MSIVGGRKNIDEVLIAGLTPHFLERDVLSFALSGSLLKTLRF